MTQPPRKPRSKFENQKPKAPPAPPSLKRDGEKVRALDEIQAELYKLIEVYGREIKGSSVPETRTLVDKQRRAETITNINSLSRDLNVASMSEGSQVVAATALHCLLILNDKINEVLIQNAHLYAKLKELEANARSNKDSVREGEAG